MKILNIVDINLIKLYLSKQYLTLHFDYSFMPPQVELLQKNLDKFTPNIILVQDQYLSIDTLELINAARKKYDGIIVLLSIDESNTEKNQDRITHNNLFYANKYNFDKVIVDIVDKLKNQKGFGIRKRSILFVDDSPTMHKLVEKTFDKDLYQIYHANDGAQGLELYNDTFPDIILSDIEMPVMDGLEFCRLVKENNRGRFIPVVIFSSLGEQVTIDTAFNYGADGYLHKPLSPEKLLDKVEEFFDSLERKKNSKILVVDDSKVIAEVLYHALTKNNLNVLMASSGKEALDIAKSERPEIIITDLEMSGMDGYELTKKIRGNPEIKDTTVIMMSSLSDQSYIKKGELLGVAKYFTKPFEPDRLVMVVEQILIEKYNGYKKEYEYMLSTIKALVTALEARDEYTSGHTERVSEYSIRLAKYMGFSKYQINQVEIAANLHDIGKIGVRDDILLKPGKLTDQEYTKIQEHAIIGAEILKPIKTLKDIIPLILFHHERWDGKGYPTMIKEEAIPYGARIIAIADTYDAMTSDRPYRKGMPKDKALRIIEENAGTQFCKKGALAFVEMIKKEEDEI